MDKESVLKELRKHFSDIEVHDDLISELLEIISATGVELVFLRILMLRLNILRNLGIQATKHKEFEPLGNHLYSMHLAGKGFNIRIIYAFLENGHPILLLSFYERAGKGKTDYSTKIAQAASRLKEFKEEH